MGVFDVQIKVGIGSGIYIGSTRGCFVISARGRRVKLSTETVTFTGAGTFTAPLLLIGHKEVGPSFYLLYSPIWRDPSSTTPAAP